MNEAERMLTKLTTRVERSVSISNEDVHEEQMVPDALVTLNGTNMFECSSCLGREVNIMNDITTELGRRKRAASRAYKTTRM